MKPFPLTILLLALCCGGASAADEKKKISLWDPEDGCFDLDAFLSKKSGFYPMVVPITEPAVGYGMAVAPVFIRLPEDGKGRPDIWAAGAMRTNNGSEGAFAGYSGYFDHDRWHLMAGGVSASVNLEFHGVGNDEFEDGPLHYNLDMKGGMIGGDVRLGDSPWRLGLRYLRADVEASFAAESAVRLPALNFEARFGDSALHSRFSSLQPFVSYDSRDNIFTPVRGFLSELSLVVNDEALGATSDYQLLTWTNMWFRPLLKDRLFLGIRGDVAQSFGDVPFYARPFVQLRGAPVMRFQGDGVTFAEAELRWQFHPRWSLVGFGGAGFTWAGEEPFERTNATATGGAGFRYLIARRHGLHVGADIAWGEEGNAVYIQFGNAWFRP